MTLDPAVVTAVLAGVVALVTAVYAGALQFRKQRNAHELQLAKVRADQYLVDFEELEDLRWWRRLAIGVVNRFLDDYTERDIEPPIDVHVTLDYPPPGRPRKKGHLKP
jgi:hypothetical protein